MNKVNVVKSHGSAAKGLMSPRPGMVTDKGTIISVTNNPIVSVSGDGVGGLRNWYAFQLSVAESVASGTFSWPTGDAGIWYGSQAAPSPDTNPSQGYVMAPNGVPFNWDR